MKANVVSMACLMLLIGIGAASGIPLGMPPAAEDPVMSQVAPEECIFYATWAGKATPDPKSTNPTEQLLANPEIRYLIKGLEKMVAAAWKENAEQQGPEAKAISNDTLVWMKVLLSRPTAIFANVDIGDQGPQIEAGMVVNLGSYATKIKESLEKHLPNMIGKADKDIQIGKRTWHRIRLKDPNAPPITWNVVGPYLIVGIGESEKVVEDILARGRTPAPKWLSKLRSQIPIDRLSTFSYLNVRKQIELVGSIPGPMGRPMGRPMPGPMDRPMPGPMDRPMPGPDVDDVGPDKGGPIGDSFQRPPMPGPGPMRGQGEQVEDVIGGMMMEMASRIQLGIKAFGLDQVTALASATGLDKEGFVNRNLLTLEGSPRGIFSLISGEPLTREDLDQIPGDATMAFAMKLDPEKVLDTVLTIASEIDPGLKDQLLQGLEGMKEQMTLDLRKDLLAPLGDRWCFYVSPSENGLSFPTAVVEVDDTKQIAQTLEKFTNIARQQMDQEGPQGPRIVQFKFAGKEIFYFDARDDEFLFTPSWCLTEDRLIVAAFPHQVKAHLIRKKSTASLATSAAVSPWYEKDANALALGYVDVKSIFDFTYTLVPVMIQSASVELAKRGAPLTLDLSLVPSVSSIRPHLKPATVVLRRNTAGIELVARHSLPVGDVMTSGPVAAALLLPAISAARQAAKRAKSVNNMKQMLLAFHNHHDAFRKFPSAYRADNNGKALLSWRVSILPFIEEQRLYDQFNMDEPWNSENNKSLIALMPDLYRAPGSSAGLGRTNYVAVRGENTVFPGEKGTQMRDIRDGTSHTIAIVEAIDDKSVIWTKPDDFKPDKDNPLAGLIGLRPDGFFAGFADGSVHMISKNIDPKILKAMFTRDGGEPVNQY